VAAIETSARECELCGEPDRASLLRGASTTLWLMILPPASSRAETDVEALMLAEGVAMRPGLRPVVADGVLPKLRRALLGMLPVVVIRYRGPDATKSTARIPRPYGILYGGRGWLVAHVDGLPEMWLWRLDRIASVDLVGRGHQMRGDINLAAYAAQSFGVFQEEPLDVVLRFRFEAADDVAVWVFYLS
jgi:predicted DNA-binding transcriptional regulator YafY